jgi:site-specific DNA-methyltransferase (adenine-specific)
LKPYFQGPGVTLFCGDVRDVLPAFPSLGLSFDLALVDPPYNETSLKWDVWPKAWPRAVLDASKPHGSLWAWGSLRTFLAYRDEFKGWRQSQEIVWEKHNGSGLAADRFRRVHELAVLFYPDGAKWRDVYHSPQREPSNTKPPNVRRSGPTHFGGSRPDYVVTARPGERLVRSVMYARSSHKRARHETQKPAPILRRLIDYSCPPAGAVLDCFMGSAEALRVAYESGREVIGIDTRESQCEAAAVMFERLSKAAA